MSQAPIYEKTKHIFGNVGSESVIIMVYYVSAEWKSKKKPEQINKNKKKQDKTKQNKNKQKQSRTIKKKHEHIKQKQEETTNNK